MDMLQALTDIYPSVTKLSCFSMPNLKGDEHPSEVLTSLLKTMEQLEMPYEWSIEKDKDEKYYIKALHEYGDSSACFICVDFLAKLQQVEPRLFEFMSYAIMLIAKTNGVSLYSEWLSFTNANRGMLNEYIHERSNESYDELEEEEEDIYKKTLDYYGPKGTPCLTYNFLKKLNPSLKIFKKQVESFVPRTELETLALPFLKLTAELATMKKRLGDYCMDVYQQGVLTPEQYKLIIWTDDHNDEMFRMMCEVMDDTANNMGIEGFMWEGKIGEDDNVEHQNFIDCYNDWFDKGRELANKLRVELKSVQERAPLPFKK